MAERKSVRSLTEEKISNHKLVLFFVYVVSFAINLFLSIVLLVDGISFWYALFPILFCVMNVAFLVVSIFTNFRFSYSLFYIIAYSLLFAATTVVFGLLLFNFGSDSAMTYVSLILWSVVSLFTLIAVIVGATRAGNFTKFSRAILVLLVFCISIGGYGYYVINQGFFGQGLESAERPVSFRYDDVNGYYVAANVLDGRSDKIIIPNTFNGVKVGAIDCAVFNTPNLACVDLRCDADVVFKNHTVLTNNIQNVKILAPKANLSTFTAGIYQTAKNNISNAENLIAFASSFAPSDLTESEVYITFAYTPESLMAADGQFMPMWIGQRGEIFKLDYANNLSYIANSNIFDENNLAQLFENNAGGDGYVLSQITDKNGHNLVGASISSSISNQPINFEKIYRITVQNDNDTRYEVEDSFRYLSDTLSYRYVTKSTAANLLGEITTRSGFDLAWRYNYGGQGTQSSLDTLESLVLSATNENISVYPVWSLKAPVITLLGTDKITHAYTYGDDVTFNVTATSPDPGIDLRYVWQFDGEDVYTSKDFNIDKVKMDEAGNYTVKVYAYSDTVTSLTSSTNSSVTITVAKKQLPISWVGLNSTDYFNKIYDGIEEQLAIKYNENDLVYSSDVITYDVSTPTLKNAGTYPVTVSLTGECSNSYYISTDQNANTYSIEQREVDIVWSVDTYTYTNSVQAPGVSIVAGVCAGDDLNVVTTGQKYAGSYTATASLSGNSKNNYKLKETQTTQGYVINPAPLTFNWTRTEQAYTANNIAPSATPIGLKGNDTSSMLNMVITTARNAGTHTVGISINNSNYYIEDGEEEFDNFVILPANITLIYSDTSKVYNSQTQKPTVTTKSLLGEDKFEDLGITVSGAKNAGTHEITVTITNTNYTLKNPTFVNFEITKAPITVIWSTETVFIYNGNGQHPAILGTDGIFESDKASVVVSVDVDASAQINVNTTGAFHTAHPTMSDPTNNYELTEGLTCNFSIIPKEIEVVWDNLTFIYDGENHLPTAEIIEGIIGTDLVPLEVEGQKSNAGKYTATVSTTNANYKITNSQEAYVINKRDIELVWSTDNAFIYNGQVQKPSIVDKLNMVSSDLYTTQFTVSGQINASINPYTATATTDDGNYNITNPTIAFTISKRDITLDWLNTSFIYNGQDQKPAPIGTVAGGLILGDDLGISVDGAKTQASESEYLATATITNTNYNLLNPQNAFTISKKDLEITWSNTSLTYNASARLPSATAMVSGGLVAGDTVIITLDGRATGVGSYTATASTTNTNYNITNPTSSFEIKPKNITVTWTGATLTYNGIAQNPSATPNGVYSGDTVNLTVLGAHVNVGTYTATVSTDNDNYNITNTTKDFTINPKVLSVVWNVSAKYTYNGNAQSPTASLLESEIITGDTVNLTLVGASTNAGGPYTARVSIDNNNYQLQTQDTTRNYSIEKRALAISWNNTNLEYTGVPQAPTAQISNGLVSGENVIVNVSGEQTHVGNHTAQASISNNNYYIATGATQQFTIIPVKVTITWENTPEFIYSGSAQAPTATSNVNGNFTINYSYEKKEDGSYVSISSKPKDVGEYRITASLSSDDYEITSNESMEYAIVPKDITASFSIGTYTYTGSPQAPSASLSETGISLGYKYEKKSANGSYMFINHKPSDAGEYRVTAIVGSNYRISNDDSCTFVIKKQAITIDFNDDVIWIFTYDGTVKTPPVEIIGNESAVSVNYKIYKNGLWISTSAPVEIGRYKVIYSSHDGNYEVVGENEIEFTISESTNNSNKIS